MWPGSPIPGLSRLLSGTVWQSALWVSDGMRLLAWCAKWFAKDISEINKHRKSYANTNSSWFVMEVIRPDNCQTWLHWSAIKPQTLSNNGSVAASFCTYVFPLLLHTLWYIVFELWQLTLYVFFFYSFCQFIMVVYCVGLTGSHHHHSGEVEQNVWRKADVPLTHCNGHIC